MAANTSIAALGCASCVCLLARPQQPDGLSQVDLGRIALAANAFDEQSTTTMRPSARRLMALTLSATRPHSVSFIGLGRMGSPMAYNLFSKSVAESEGTARFVVCDARTAVAEAFAADFVKQFPGTQVDIANSPEEAVLASQTVVTMLPSTPHVRNVYAESGGILPALLRLPREAVQSTLCIDSTTLDVETARTLVARADKIGVRMVDAPVSGGVAGAKAGTLSFLVGGTNTAFELARPTLERMGKHIIYCGGSGAGLAAKICNNLVLGVQQIVVSEAMLLGQKLGLQPKVLASVINTSTGACWASSVNNPVPGAVPDKSPPCERDYEGGFATRLMLKDMGLALNIAESTKTAMPLGAAAGEIYAEVIADDPDAAEKDFSAVYRYLRLPKNKED
ncbi:3-hydroxyisobutyrate dehydrogenase [Rhodofomes roseus]|uniref:3-hydroxyisobutyrate dehydrogenase n=1 Tax=Rhodofomes roseus TaxID=34475 RepID=A0ABQ8JYG1_9APHY|nr:3-hydroxyisobutyrate dehydrogenase [Rhodofomes roseus]KAH9829195.1 3-hydroxyisobutyrate dehydrogenase [Rhodofomes roseus]